MQALRLRSHGITIAAGFAFLASCSSPDPRVLRGHILASDALGNRDDPYGCVADNRQIFEQMDHACSTKAPGKVRRVFVHIHGGRVSPRKAHFLAQDAVQGMGGENARNWMYPIFLTWPSDDVSTVWDHLTCLRRGDPWPRMGPATAPLVLTAEVASGVAKAPRSLLYMWLTDLGVGLEVLGFRGANSLMPSWRESEASLDAATASGFHLRPGEYESGFLEQAGRFVMYLLTFPLKVVTEITILDGIGNGAWRAMYHNALSTVRRPKEFHYAGRQGDNIKGDATGVFARFFDDLTAHIERQGTDKYEITLIAHSMGAIVYNRLFVDGTLAGLPVKNVVYMAPACTVAAGADAFRHLDEDRKRHLHEPKDAQLPNYYVLTLHPLAEAQEAQWALGDIVPRGSLLEWIDSWYSEPRHPLERVMGKWINATRALPLFAELKERFYLRAFDCKSGDDVTTHGGFNERKFWRKEFWWPSQ